MPSHESKDEDQNTSGTHGEREQGASPSYRRDHDHLECDSEVEVEDEGATKQKDLEMLLAIGGRSARAHGKIGGFSTF